MSNAAPTWVIDWLTSERYSKYLRAAGGDHARALELYDWNAELAAALLHDLGHVEVGLRNAYDRALRNHPWCLGQDWIEPATYDQMWPRHIVIENGQPQDKNATPRANIKAARKRARYETGGTVHRGKVVAELMFGFWSYLSDSLHEKTLWVPTLNQAYVPGTDRARIHDALTELRDVRNRLAHSESIFDRQPENTRRRIVLVARQLSPELHAHIVRSSTVQAVLAQKP